MTETEFGLNLKFRIRSPSLNSCQRGCFSVTLLNREMADTGT